MSIKKKIGIFGSAFDPPTLGHADAIMQACDILDGVILVASAHHAFGKKMALWHHRIAMLQLFIQRLPNLFEQSECQVRCVITMSDVERRLLQANPCRPVYTFDVMSTLQTELSDHVLYFLRGPDNAEPHCWQQFYRYKDIENQWAVLTLEQKKNIRSSMVRNVISNNASMESDQMHSILKNLVTPEIGRYLLEHRLYE